MIILVTGLMRTGTSLISRQLHLMGVPMGTVMRFPLSQSNGQEDWEDVAFTDLMVNRAGQLDTRDRKAFLADIRLYADRRQKEHSIWGMKSPFALPFVKDIREVLGDDLRVVLTSRNLTQTYDSLRKQLCLPGIEVLQDVLLEALPGVKSDIVIDIEESWNSPETVEQKLKALIRS